MGARQTVEENLNRLAVKRAAGRELYLLSLSELAEKILSSIGRVSGVEEMLDLLGESSCRELFSAQATDKDVLPALRPLMMQMAELDTATDVAVLSLLLSEQIKEKHGEQLPWREQVPSRVRVAYLPSPRAEAAFRSLCKARPETALLYADSLEGACEALSENADYALLPYIAEDGTPLSSVLRLIGRHDLYLCASVPVEEEDGLVRYGLFSKEVAPFSMTDEMQTDVRVSATDLGHLSAMMAELPLFGFRQTALFSEGETYGRVSARLSLAGEGDAMALFIYFSLFSNGFSLLGRYPHLSAEE